jgi:uncharacterized protein (TIGR04562 family)
VGLTAEFRKRYEFDWEILDVIIGGHSAIDGGKSLGLRGLEDAQRFMECYGYDLENPIHKAELFGNFQEALTFIRHYFLQPENPGGLKLEIPRKIQELSDISQLLVLAGTGGGGGSRLSGRGSPNSALASHWACAIIKVMHTIAHMDKDLRTNYFTDIQKQILDRFYKFIHRDEGGQIFLGRDTRDADRVDLVLFDSKPKKSRDSVILKLLHKPENVAEELFDRVGIRFVTRNRLDALRVVKYLKDSYVIMPANIKPSRSRNTLLDTTAFKVEVAQLLEKVDIGKLVPGDLYSQLKDYCEKAGPPNEGDKENPHSSRHYRAIQFTGRQLVRISNPLYDDLKAIKSAMKGKAVPEEIGRIVEGLDLKNLQKEIRFFYPFEVQVLDEASHTENLAGRSSHSNYKKSQVQAAMKRVLGDLMRLSEGDAQG